MCEWFEILFTDTVRRRHCIVGLEHDAKLLDKRAPHILQSWAKNNCALLRLLFPARNYPECLSCISGLKSVLNE